MINRLILTLILAILAFGLNAISTVIAQPYPNRPVRFLVPFSAGGATDVAARTIAEYLTRAFRRQVYIENRSGAGGSIGIEGAAKSAPDGYTVLVTGDAVASVGHIIKLHIDPLNDFAPIIQLVRQPVVLAVHPSLDVGSVSELVSLAKRHPGLNYAVAPGLGSLQHIVVEWFAQIAGIELAPVVYRGGGAAITDLVAGHLKIGSLGSTPLIPHYKAGNLRLLAQSTAARSPSLLDVPTFQDAGIAGLALDQWFGVFAPTGTPPGVIARLNTEIDKALNDTAVRENLLNQSLEPVGGTAEQFSRVFRDDYFKYGRLIKELNIKGE